MYSSPRAVVILATIVAASLLCGASGLSDTDLVRARTLVPRPQFRGETFADMSRTLNLHLQATPQLQTKPCDQFSLEELHRLHQLLDSVRDRALQAVFSEVDDNRRLPDLEVIVRYRACY